MSNFQEKLAKANLNDILNNMPKEYANIYLAARRDYINLRLRSELDIINLYEDVAKEVATELRKANGLNKARLQDLLLSIKKNLNQEYSKLLKSNIEGSVKINATAQREMMWKIFDEADLGDTVSQAGLVSVSQAVASETVEAFYARKTNGLTLSQRVWKNTQKPIGVIQRAISSGQGMDARKLARTMETYISKDASQLTVGESKALQERMGGTVPKDLKYNALRLARTELSNAFAESTYSAGESNPFYEGIIWRLSSRHPVPDICDSLVGKHPKGKEPPVPHPNCLCTQLPDVENLGRATDRAIAWVNNPSVDPSLENWYQNIYLPHAS